MVIEPRLAADVRIASIKRLAAAGGDFVTIVRRGDPVSGAILILALQRGQVPQLFEQMPTIDGTRPWQLIWTEAQNMGKERVSDYLDRRLGRDPDLWVIELDVASSERLNEILLQIA